MLQYILPINARKWDAYHERALGFVSEERRERVKKYKFEQDGINSSRVKEKENIHLEQTPYPIDISKDIAEKCKKSKRKAMFYEYIKNPDVSD